MTFKAIKITETVKSLYDSLMPYPWLYFQFHDSLNDAADDAYDRAYAQNNGQATALFTNGLNTITGTNTNIWSTNPGWLTPSGDNYIQNTDEDVRAFFDMSTLTNTGGLLMCFRLKIGALPSGASEYFLSHSGADTTTGGFEIQINTTGKVFVAAREQNNSSATNVCGDTLAISVDTEYAYCIYLNCVDGTAVMYRDGVEQNSSLNPIPTPYPIMNTVRGMVICGKSGSLASNKLNQNSSGGHIRDVLIVRATSDISADVGAIAQQYSDVVGDIPNKLVSDYV